MLRWREAEKASPYLAGTTKTERQSRSQPFGENKAGRGEETLDGVAARAAEYG